MPVSWLVIVTLAPAMAACGLGRFQVPEIAPALTCAYRNEPANSNKLRKAAIWSILLRRRGCIGIASEVVLLGQFCVLP